MNVKICIIQNTKNHVLFINIKKINCKVDLETISLTQKVLRCETSVKKKYLVIFYKLYTNRLLIASRAQKAEAEGKRVVSRGCGSY